MAERLVLDAVEVSRGRQQLDITELVGGDGPDFGDAAIEQSLAQGSRGQVPVDFRVPNRTITIPLLLRGDGGFTFDQLRTFIQAKCGLIQREGGWLKRQLAGGVVYADLVGATLHFGGSRYQATRDLDPDAVLTLEALPDWYGDEIALSVHAETTAPILTFTETGIQGDYPGRVRLVVDDNQNQTQLGLLWGFRGRHYSAANTARLTYQAEAMSPLDRATVFGSVVVHGSLGSGWTPVLSTDTTGAGAGPLTHTGTYRVWARMSTGNVRGISTRLCWDVGDYTEPTENPPFTFTVVNQSYLVDLGEIRIDPAQVGTHRWQGQIQARTPTPGGAVTVDWVLFQPLDDGGGVLRALDTQSSLTSFASRDEFDQHTNGTLGGTSDALGNVWATQGGATDFEIQDSPWGVGKVLARVQFDGFSGVSRVALSSGSYSRLTTSIGFSHTYVPTTPTSSNGAVSGVVQRWSSGGANHVAAQARNIVVADPSGNYVACELEVHKIVSNATTTLGTAYLSPLVANRDYTLVMSTDINGVVRVALRTQPGTKWDLVVYDQVLATGGSLASGQPGFFDNYKVTAGFSLNIRWYDNWAAWTPVLDAVLFPGRSAEIRYDGAFRETAGGSAYGPVAWVEGDLPRIPPSGLESRTIECVVKGSRGNLKDLPDTSAGDDIQAQLFYRPSWLFVPESAGAAAAAALFPAPALFPASSLFPE